MNATTLRGHLLRFDCSRMCVQWYQAGGGGGLPSVTKVTQQDIQNLFALNFDSMCYGMKCKRPAFGPEG